MILLTMNRLFWQNGTGGILNQADFFETVASQIQLHTGDISKLEDGLLVLKNGAKISTDAILVSSFPKVQRPQI